MNDNPIKTIRLKQSELVMLRDALANHIIDRKFPRDCSKDHIDLLIKEADNNLANKLLPIREYLNKRISKI